MDIHDIHRDTHWDSNKDSNKDSDRDGDINGDINNIEGTANHQANDYGSLEFRQRLLSYVDCHWEEARPLSISTFDTRAITLDGKDYVVKHQLLDEGNLSPFWQMMREIFESDFARQRAAMPKICSMMKENPHIPPAKLVLTDEERKVLIYEKMEGQAWEPDCFPDNPQICLQLGRFIGWNHSHPFPACGLPGKTDIEDVKWRLLNYVTGKDIRKLCGDPCDETCVDLVAGLSAELSLKHSPLPCRTSEERYAMIMTDISANQFLFGPERIQACVDLDAYVIGPVEWELAVLANCVPNWAAFREGYEEYCRLPELDTAANLFVRMLSS